MQESVYCKMSLNQTSACILMDRIEKVKLHSGVVQILTITEKQFQAMEFLVGESKTEQLNSDRSVIII